MKYFAAQIENRYFFKKIWQPNSANSNSCRFPDVAQHSESCQLRESPAKWFGITKALVGDLYTLGKSLLYSFKRCLPLKAGFEWHRYLQGTGFDSCKNSQHSFSSEEQFGGWKLKTPQRVWIIQGKTMAKPLQALLHQGYTTAILTAYAPGQHMWLSWDPRPYSKCSKTVEVGCSCLELKPCKREIATDEIQEEKVFKKRSNIKASVSITHIGNSGDRLWWLGLKTAASNRQSMVHVFCFSYFGPLNFCSLAVAQSLSRNDSALPGYYAALANAQLDPASNSGRDTTFCTGN